MLAIAPDTGLTDAQVVAKLSESGQLRHLEAVLKALAKPAAVAPKNYV